MLGHGETGVLLDEVEIVERNVAGGFVSVNGNHSKLFNRNDVNTITTFKTQIAPDRSKNIKKAFCSIL